ncbi:glycosyltransferase [Bradyrhizobium sp.]|uniref:glycosyltransferase n=1 Tax=Bradyrhizobium sp. TaxID=376 RepID=UPI003C75E8F5
MIKPKRCDVLIVGSLINNDVIIAEALSKLGISCIVARTTSCPKFESASLPIVLKFFSQTDIVTVKSTCEFARLIMSASAILTFGGTVTSFFGRLYPIVTFFPLPPILNVATGADLSEMALENTLRGWTYRRLLRKAQWNVIAAHPMMFDAVVSLRLNNFLFIRHPYAIADIEIRDGCSAKKDTDTAGSVVYLHPSNLDWGATDTGGHRRTFKRNDLFLKAFIRALAAGADVRCIILDRGPDRTIARQMINASGRADRFEWRNRVDSAGLVRLIRQADVVVDQFDVGGLGGIAIEAMGQAKAVMTFIDEQACSIYYDDMPPVINCKTEDQIFEQIMLHSDRNKIAALGQRAWEWVVSNHRKQSDVRELAVRIKLAGRGGWRLTPLASNGGR